MKRLIAWSSTTAQAVGQSVLQKMPVKPHDGRLLGSVPVVTRAGGSQTRSECAAHSRYLAS